MLRFFFFKAIIDKRNRDKKMWNTTSCYRHGLIITQNEMTSDKFEQHVNGILTTVSHVMTNSKLFISRQSKFF